MKSIYFYIFLLLGILVSATGLFCDIFSGDSALYALISKNLVNSDSFTHLMLHGNDWLDKPHFPFWIAALFFKLFGSTALVYKLSGFVFFLMATWYVYLLAQSLYNLPVARLSTLIFISSIHIIVSNNDLRAETYLMALVIGAVYHGYRYEQSHGFKHAFVAIVYTACAVMTKGIFLLIPIFGAFIGNYFIQQDYRKAFSAKWLLVLILVLIGISPELYSLYLQFDLHPEKVVFGKSNVSGIKFFFWDSQFGRFTNTGPIKGSGDIFFFLHTILWAYAPWVLLWYVAVYDKLKGVFRAKGEYITIAATLPLFVLFSLSQFQLPFYTNILFPFFSILVANYYIHGANGGRIKQICLGIYLFVIPVFVGLLHWYFVPGHTLLLFIYYLMSGILVLFIHFQFHQKYKLALYAVVVCLFLGLYSNTIFYPKLLHYQADSEAAKYITQQNKKVTIAGIDAHLTEFYSAETPLLIDRKDISSQQRDRYVYTDAEGLANCRERSVDYTIIRRFDNYRITLLTLAFLNPNTRTSTLNYRYIISIKP